MSLRAKSAPLPLQSGRRIIRSMAVATISRSVGRPFRAKSLHKINLVRVFSLYGPCAREPDCGKNPHLPIFATIAQLPLIRCVVYGKLPPSGCIRISARWSGERGSNRIYFHLLPPIRLGSADCCGVKYKYPRIGQHGIPN